MNLISASRKIGIMSALLMRHPREAKFAYLWLRSLLPGHSPLEDELPWITFRAIRWLSDFLRPQMRVFEYGAGGSTLFLGRRVSQVVSVEHDEAFFTVVRKRVAKAGMLNCWLLLRPAEQAPLYSDAEVAYGSGSFTSNEPKYLGKRFEKYVKAIDDFPDAHFDLVMVDGRARASCVGRAISKVKPGGAILLDNSDRPAYAAARRLLDGYRRTDMFGIVPWNLVPYQTSVWRIDT